MELLSAAQDTARREAQRQEARRRRAFAIGLVGAVVLAVIAVGVSLLVALPALNRQTSDVATQVSADVGEQVVLDARQQRILTGRRELTEANARLTARDLPVVPDPGPAASGDELLVQAARANVIADLPEDQIAGLRDLPGTALPSALTRPREGSSANELGDRVVTVLPIVPGQGPVTVEPDDRGGGAPARCPNTSNGRASTAPPATTSGGRDTTVRPERDRPELLRPCLLRVLLC